MKKISKLVAKVVGKNIQKEMNSACIVFGYQPKVPASAKKFESRKNK